MKSISNPPFFSIQPWTPSLPSTEYTSKDHEHYFQIFNFLRVQQSTPYGLAQKYNAMQGIRLNIFWSEVNQIENGFFYQDVAIVSW